MRMRNIWVVENVQKHMPGDWADFGIYSSSPSITAAKYAAHMTRRDLYFVCQQRVVAQEKMKMSPGANCKDQCNYGEAETTAT
jgi:hypothetical protein